MKKRTHFTQLAVLLAAVLIMLSGCDPVATLGEGTLSIALGSSRSLVLLPEIDMEIATYTISGSGPNGGSFEEEGFGGSVFERAGLAVGDWSIAVDGYNAGGTRIGTAVVELTIRKNQTTSATATLRPLEGAGTFSGTVSWTDSQGLLSDPQVWVTVRDEDGDDIQDISIPTQLTVSGQTASGSAELPAGWYEVTVGLYEGVPGGEAMVVWQGVLAVRIVAVQTTSGTLEIPEEQIRFGTGGVSIVIEEDMDNPLSVGFFVSPDAVAVGREATFSLVREPSDTARYRWYVDGERQDESSAVFRHTFSEAGEHTVSMLVVDGGAMGGYGQSVEVAGGELGSFDFHDDFSTDTRNDYEICYNSNDSGYLEYSPGELGFIVSGWNGIQIKQNQDVVFPEYTKIIFKLISFGTGSDGDHGEFILNWSEFGVNALGWVQLYRMNSFLWIIRGSTMYVELLHDESSNENSYGERIFYDSYSINLSDNILHTIEIVREGVDVMTYINDELICTVQIPENFLDVGMNLAFGVDGNNGSDAYVDSIGYGNY